MRLRRINFAMALAGITGVGALIWEYGFGVPPHLSNKLHKTQIIAAYIFCFLQLYKLFVVPRAYHYFRKRWFDFAVVFVFLFQLIVGPGLKNLPEYIYLSKHGNPTPLAGGALLVAQAYFMFVGAIRTPWFHKLLLKIPLQPTQVLMTSFLAIILVGTAALKLPLAINSDKTLTWIDALFTATSASCVTGLTVVDTSAHFSIVGTSVILILIQIGGLGILTITAFAALYAGGGLIGREAKALSQIFELPTLGSIRRTLTRIIGITLLVEAIGSFLLYQSFRETIPDHFVRIQSSIFHAVSAYCNAGFSLFSDSLYQFRDHSVVMAIFSSLILLGSLGYPVISKGPQTIWYALHGKFSRINRHVKVVLVVNAALIVLGSLLFMIFEWNGVLSGESAVGKFWNSVFVPITTRTCGFQTFDLSGMQFPTMFLFIILMLIGGSPASTSGGMKTTVLAILMFRLRSVLTNKTNDVSVFHVDAVEWGKAFWVVTGMMGGFFLSAAALALAEGRFDIPMMFESASAVGTVGLSTGLTQELSQMGKLVVVVAMFVGRVGPTCLALGWALRHPQYKPTETTLGVG